MQLLMSDDMILKAKAVIFLLKVGLCNLSKHNYSQVYLIPKAEMEIQTRNNPKFLLYKVLFKRQVKVNYFAALCVFLGHEISLFLLPL